MKTIINPGAFKKIVRFYLSFAPAPLLVTLTSAYLYYKSGSETLVSLIWLKLLTDFIIWFFVKTMSEKKLYYYYNLNISRAKLWLTAFLVDLLVLIVLFLLITPIPQPL